MVETQRDDSSESGSTAAMLVAAARAKRGVSQRELARAAEVPQSTVSTIESGLRQPSVEMLERLLDAAGFTLETRLRNAIPPSKLLESYRGDVAEIIGRYPIERVWVFGSVARGSDNVESDLDLLVEPAPGASVADVLGLDEEIAATLGCAVDIVSTTELESNDLLRHRVHQYRCRLTPTGELYATR